MSGELKIQLKDGTNYWFGRDDRFPNEVRIYGSDPHHWQYVPTEEAQQIVQRGLDHDAEVQQGDAIRFFLPEAGEGVG